MTPSDAGRSTERALVVPETADAALLDKQLRSVVDVEAIERTPLEERLTVVNFTRRIALALAARHHRIPFFVVAPLSTVDTSIPDGGAIVIEERAAGEITHFAGVQMAPDGAEVFNPAFDVTPADLITAVVTEDGLFKPC